jgi:hypothetical protein
MRGKESGKFSHISGLTLLRAQLLQQISAISMPQAWKWRNN